MAAAMHLSQQHSCSFDHLVGAQTWTFLIGLLLAVVPDIGCELPVASDLLPHHEIFAGDFFRHRPLGLEAEGPNLSRRGGPEWLDRGGCQVRIPGFLPHRFSTAPRSRLSPSPGRNRVEMRWALQHRGTRRRRNSGSASPSTLM